MKLQEIWGYWLWAGKPLWISWIRVDNLFWRPPFVSTDPMVTYNAILRGVGSLIWPKYLSDDAVNLIFNFCRRDPHQRLGYGRMDSIREDPWFNLFDFDAFRSFKMRPPFIPNVSIKFRFTPDNRSCVLDGWPDKRLCISFMRPVGFLHFNK